MNKINMLASVGAAVLGLVPGAVAQAQTAATASNVGEVVVTATKTGVTNLQKTPLSVAVVGGSTLKNAQVVTLKDLPSVVSGLAIDVNSQTMIPRIRGIGGATGIGDGDVSVYMDGVYLSRTSVAWQSNFNDLERVEVVKGPQGTLFGRNAVGGAINFITKRPSKTFTLQNTLAYGNYNLIDEALSVSGPLTANMQASLAVGYVNRAGYVDNILPNMPDLGSANRTNVRTQWQWEVTDNITNLVRADYIYTNEIWSTNQTLLVRTDDPRIAAAARFSAPLSNSTVGDLRKVASDLTPRALEQAYGINDELNWVINDHLTLNNLIAYRTDKSVSSHVANDATEYYAADSGSVWREHQFSNELNLQHNFGPLTGVVGLYFYQEWMQQYFDSFSGGRNPARTGAGTHTFQDTRQPTISRGAFFSETFHVTPELGLTLGGRYTEEYKRYDGINTQWVFDPGAANNGALTASNVGADFPFIRGYGSNKPSLNKTDVDFSPKVAVDWQVTPDALFYVSATQGFRSGGYSNAARKDTASGTLTPQFTVPVKADFEPEKITSYEIGAKTDWFDKRLRFNIAVFRNDWKDLQVTSTVAPSVNYTNNAAKARTSGADFDITAKPLDGLTFTLGATYLPEAKYVEYKNASPPQGIILSNLTAANDPRLVPANLNPLGTATYDASGKRLTSAPKTSLNFSAQKDITFADGGEFYVRGEYNYTSITNYEVTNDPLVSRPAFSTYGGQIGYTLPGGHWQTSLWGRNLGDEQFVNYINAGGQITAAVGDPRTFGVRINYYY
jgi:iron complex outermembrane receptor protein